MLVSYLESFSINPDLLEEKIDEEWKNKLFDYFGKEG